MQKKRTGGPGRSLYCKVPGLLPLHCQRERREVIPGQRVGQTNDGCYVLRFLFIFQQKQPPDCEVSGSPAADTLVLFFRYVISYHIPGNRRKTEVKLPFIHFNRMWHNTQRILKGIPCKCLFFIKSTVFNTYHI